MAVAPLRGVLVVDLSRQLPGPLAARLLADLGARVIKVEEPREGDPVRGAGPLVGGKSPLATMLLAGVESIALDLKQPAAVEVVRGLLGRADVLLESFRPGTLARFGLSPSMLRERFPRLVICSLTGWGQEGPYAARAGHDLTYQAIGGSLAATGALPAVPVADVVGAWSAVGSVLAALVARERGGGGAWIDQSLLDAAQHANVTGWAAEEAGAKVVGEALPLTGALPCYGVYPARDGRPIAVAALEPHFWRRFCEAAGRGDLVRSQYARGKRAREKVGKLVASRTSEEWAALLAERDVPVEPVLALGEALAHPQVALRALLRRGADGLPRLGFPARFDGERPRAGESVPGLGTHTMDVLAELGLGGDRSAHRLRQLGVGRQPSARGWIRRMLTRRG